MRGSRYLVPVVFVLAAGALFWRMEGLGWEGAGSVGRAPAPAPPASDTVLKVDSARVASHLAGSEAWETDFSRVTVPPGGDRLRRTANATVAGLPLVVFWAPGASSPLDEPRVSQGRDVGQTAVFDRRLEGRTLTFRREGDGG